MTKVLEVKDNLVKIMQRYKKGVIIVAVAIISIITSYLIWGRAANPIKSIPPNAAIVVRGGDGLNESIEQLGNFSPTILEDYKVINQFAKAIAITYDQQQSYYTASRIRDTHLSLSLAFPYQKQLPIDSILSSIKTSNKFKGATIYELELDDGTPLALSIYKKVCLIGRLPLQVEAGIAALHANKNTFIPDLNPGAFYINHNNLLLETGWPFPKYYKQYLLKAGKWGSGWTLQLEKEDNNWNIQGQLQQMKVNALPYDSLVPWAFLPTNIEWAMQWPVVQDKTKEGNLFGEFISGIIKDVVIGFQLPSQRASYLIALKDAAQAEKMLSELAATTAEVSRYNYQLFQVRQLLVEDLLSPLEIEIDNPHLLVLGDYLLVTAERLAMEQTLAHIVSNQTLEQNLFFLENWASLPDKPAAWMMSNTVMTDSIQSTSFYEQLLLIKIGEDGKLSGVLKKAVQEVDVSDASLLWSAQLDNDAVSEVYGYETRMGIHLLVQDIESRLYCLNEAGSILWKYQLNGPLLGGIHKVDYFRTGEPCYSFSTKRSIYMLDAKGQPIANFPVHLPHPATAPVLVTDLEGNGQFAFFTPDTTGSIYAFERQGVPLSGWNPEIKLDSTAFRSLQHVQHKNEDYLIGLCDTGTLYLLARDGSLHGAPIPTAQQYISPPFYQDVVPLGRIALGDVDGRAHIFNLEGAYFRLILDDQGQPPHRFLFINMVGDERKDYFSYRKMEYSLKYYKENVFGSYFSKNTQAIIDTAFILKHTPYNWVGMLHKEQQRINLVLPDGTFHPAFPLAGTTPYSLVKRENHRLMVVVGNGQRVYAYQILDVQ